MHRIVVYTLRMLSKAKVLPASSVDCKDANNNIYLWKAKYWGIRNMPSFKITKKKQTNPTATEVACIEHAALLL